MKKKLFRHSCGAHAVTVSVNEEAAKTTLADVVAASERGDEATIEIVVETHAPKQAIAALVESSDDVLLAFAHAITRNVGRALVIIAFPEESAREMIARRFVKDAAEKN